MAAHPKYRTIGFGAKLIRETLPSVGTPFTAMIAAIAKTVRIVAQRDHPVRIGFLSSKAK